MSPIEEIIKTTIEYDEQFGSDWASFSLVIRLDEDGLPNGTNGYLYKADGDFEAISVKPRLLRPSVMPYLKDIYGDDKLPIKMLVQFDRLSGRYKTEFEDKDDSRWRVRPADIDGYIEELRPKFEA